MIDPAKRKLTWRKDSLDARDWKYGAPRKLKISLPAKVDLRPQMPGVYDQGEIGSCVGNGIAAAYEYVTRKENEPDFLPSRLFIYFNARSLENAEASDSGCEIRDGIKSAAEQGVCHEVPTWSYSQPFNRKPTAKAYREASRHKITSYRKVDNTSITELRAALAQSLPIVFGMMLVKSFISLAVSKSGRVPFPKKGEEVLGGHCMLLCGYDHRRKVFIVRNSWGEEWGMSGYAEIGYAYIANKEWSDDFWVIAANS